MAERVIWSIRKRASRGGGRRKLAGYVLAYRLPGMPATKYKTFAVRERATAVSLAGEFRRELECEMLSGRDGGAVKRAALRSYGDHVGEFVGAMEAKRRAGMYAYNAGKLLERLGSECGWRFLRDIDAASVLAWRRVQTLKPKTIKGYMDFLWAFVRWLVDAGRLAACPLRRADVLVKVDDEATIRALTADECGCLLAVTSGERRCCYLLAILTGLRRAEIDALLWHDVHLDAAEPFLWARASTTKNGRRAAIHLRDDLVAELRRVRPGDAAADDAVFPSRCPSMEAFRADLVSASIPEADAVGRRTVFHSLRHTLATNLCLARVSVPEAMRVMRHSDARLLHRIYADPSAFMSPQTLAGLPRFNLPGSTVQSAVTGSVTSFLGNGGGVWADVSENVTKVDGVKREKTPEKTGENAVPVRVCPDVSEKGESWGTRIRT